MENRKFFTAAILFCFFLCSSQLVFGAQKILLAVCDETPDYQITHQAFQSGLEQAAKQQGLDIEWVELKIAADNKPEFIRRLKELENSIDMVFVTGTPNASAVKQAGIKKPVLFAAVANPKKAKLVRSFNAPGTNFTGCYCAVSANSQLQTVLSVLTGSKRLAIIYNPDDPAPVSQVEEWVKAVIFLKDPNIKLEKILIPKQVSSVQDMISFMNTLDKSWDVLITTADVKISNYGAGIIQVANQDKIPTYAGLNSEVEKGALLSLGFKFKQAAEQVSVPQAVKILKGILPSNIPVGTLPEYTLAINLNTAKQIGFVFPEAIIESADIKITEDSE
ncbi:MAG: ABC transporter substrate-binding protein [Candidatus Omnitrophota bacterium]